MGNSKNSATSTPRCFFLRGTTAEGRNIYCSQPFRTQEELTDAVIERMGLGWQEIYFAIVGMN